uniref:Uncharacterized protein n=1 Tax=Laticauda laticaudata TaxID=8630 RepID=A0A8C5WW45_LATLA
PLHFQLETRQDITMQGDWGGEKDLKEKKEVVEETENGRDAPANGNAVSISAGMKFGRWRSDNNRIGRGTWKKILRTQIEFS